MDFHSSFQGTELGLFIKFCQILAMKRNVCKEITSMDFNDKTIALLQPNESLERSI